MAGRLRSANLSGWNAEVEDSLEVSLLFKKNFIDYRSGVEDDVKKEKSTLVRL